MDRLFENSLVNLKKLLEKRGYTLGEETEDESTYYLEFTTDTGRSGKVVWSFEDQEGKQYVTDVFDELFSHPKHLILVYRNITNYALKMYRDYFKDYFKAEMIDIKFLQKYVFDHPLVPEYIPLTKEEKEHIVKEYGGNEMNLPYMFDYDPVAIAFNCLPGTHLK